MAMLHQPTALEFPGHWPRSHAALSASEGNEGRTRITEFHEDRGSGGGVKRGYISSRFVAPVSQLRAPNGYSRELSIRSESPAVANPGSITTKCDVFPDGDTTNCK